MLSRRFAPTFFLVVSLLALLRIPAVDAQPPVDRTALYLVIDNSGSMDGNDPQDLRYAATRLLLDVADEWDEIGVLCFGNSAETMLPLEPLGPIEQRNSKKQSATRQNCRADGGTVMELGVAHALAELQSSSAPRKYLLLLTDGAPNNPDPARQSIEQAIAQGVSVIPVALTSPGDSSLAAFMASLPPSVRSQPVTSSGELLEQFASIYSAIKPDRYVALLGPGRSSEFNVSSLQQVSRLSFVTTSDVRLLDTGNQPVNCQQAECIDDIEQKYRLVTLSAPTLEGSWRLSIPEPAIAITKANFRPAIAFPPVDDVVQTGFYYPRSGSQTIIARLEGANENSPFSINGSTGRVAVNSQGSFTYQFTPFPTIQTQATIKLGESATPLIVEKSFTLAPLPDPEPDLPHLAFANPDAQGIAAVGGNQEIRLQIRREGNQGLVSREGVYAIVVNRDSGEPLFPPQPLQPASDGSGWESTLLKLDPGTSYEAIVWLDATRSRDGARYGDQISVSFTIGGAILIAGGRRLTFVDFQSGNLPLKVTVTEPNRTVDLQTSVVWTEAPQGAATTEFSAQLAALNYQNGPTDTSLGMRAPAELCALTEGLYRGQLLFSSTSGLPVIPATLPIEDSVSNGDVRPITTRVDLGRHCALPGIANILCEPVFGDETDATASIEVEIPQCLSHTNLEARAQEDPYGLSPIVIAPIDRSYDPPRLPLRLNGNGLQPNTALSREATVSGTVLIGRKDRPERAVPIVFDYRTQSIRSILAPMPFSRRPIRVGNLLSTVVLYSSLAVFGYKGLQFIFGSRRPPNDSRQNSNEGKVSGDTGRSGAGRGGRGAAPATARPEPRRAGSEDPSRRADRAGRRTERQRRRDSSEGESPSSLSRERERPRRDRNSDTSAEDVSGNRRRRSRRQQ